MRKEFIGFEPKNWKLWVTTGKKQGQSSNYWQVYSRSHFHLARVWRMAWSASQLVSHPKSVSLQLTKKSGKTALRSVSPLSFSGGAISRTYKFLKSITALVCLDL